MRRTPIRRKSPRQKVKDRLHDLWRDCLIARDGDRCRAKGQGGIACGGGLQAHHVYGKGPYPALRYHLENGVLVCRNHHLYWLEIQPPTVTLPWLEATLGAYTLSELERAAKVTKGGKTKSDPEAIRLYLQKELERIEANQ